jgi:single-strand DNA-binding protein
MLLGNLGADPELRMTGGGQAVLKVRLATSEQYLDKDKQRQERTEWHSVIVWGKRGEGLAKILKKGDRILVEGRLRTESWEDKDGNKRYRTEVVATEVLLQGSAGGKRERAPERESEAGPQHVGIGVDDFGDDEIPF